MKILILISLLSLFLVSCWSAKKIQANNYQVAADLQEISRLIEYDIISKKIGTKLDIKDINYDLTGKSYWQTYQVWIGVSWKTYQVMWYTCNSELRKVAVIKWNYHQRTKKPYKIVKAWGIGWEADNVIHYELKNNDKPLNIWDSTNLWVVKATRWGWWGLMFEEKVNRDVEYVSLLEDTPLWLIYNETWKEYIDGKIIWDCEFE